MECLDKEGDWEDQPDICENEEIQLGRAGTQWNPLDSSRIEKVGFEEMLQYYGHEGEDAPHILEILVVWPLPCMPFNRLKSKVWDSLRRKYAE